MTTLTVIGYEPESYCEHCGRALKHGIRISDGRVVGAQCLNKALTKAKTYRGKTYRLGAELIIKAAKVVEFIPPSKWPAFGIDSTTLQFETV